MLAQAAERIGVSCRVLDPSADAPARRAAPLTVAAFDDTDALRALRDAVEYITYEFENVPASVMCALAADVTVRPNPAILSVAQDRVAEKTLFAKFGIATPKFLSVDSDADIHQALAHVGIPAVMKTRRGGYDGKGQFVIHEIGDAGDVMAVLGDAPLICEEFVQFDRELSIISARSTTGEIAHYPVVENHHRGGILYKTIAPAPGLTEELQAHGEEYARRILVHFDYVGVLAIELFDRGIELLANEMAPRVHNSGHWSIEGAVTSQFENHVRSVCGMSLGETRCVIPTVMLNCVGILPDAALISRVEGAVLHDYGKVARPGRKLGHVTLCCDDPTTLAERLEILEGLIEWKLE